MQLDILVLRFDGGFNVSQQIRMRPISHPSTYQQMDVRASTGTVPWVSMIEEPGVRVPGCRIGKIVFGPNSGKYPEPIHMFRRAAVAGSPSQFDQVDPIVRLLHVGGGPRYSRK